MHTLTPRQMAWRLAQDLDAAVAPWLGPGLPQLLHEFRPGAGHHDPRATLAIIEADAVSPAGEFHCAGALALPAALTQLWILAPLFGHRGLPTLVEQLAQTTASAVRATRLYSDVALFELQAGQVWLRALVEGITLHTLQLELDVELQVSPQLTLLQIPAALGGHY